MTDTTQASPAAAVSHVSIVTGDARDLLRAIPDGSVQCCVTSPPYFGLRDYKNAAQIGAEQTPNEYVAELVEVFRSVRRTLRDDGTLWLNLGDSYAGSSTGGFRPGSGRADGIVDARGQRNRNGNGCPPGCKPKDLIGIPWMVAFALRADGWWLRSEVTWCKGNGMPESASDRPTSATEKVFLLAKSSSYYYADEPDDAGERNSRNWWVINVRPFPGAHFATFPPELAARCVKAGSRPGDTVLDPFAGSGTTALVSSRLGRKAIGLELNPDYAEMARNRVRDDCPMFTSVSPRMQSG